MEDLEGRGPREGPPGVGGYPGDPGELSTLIIKFWGTKPYDHTLTQPDPNPVRPDPRIRFGSGPSDPVWIRFESGLDPVGTRSSNHLEEWIVCIESFRETPTMPQPIYFDGVSSHTICPAIL